MCLFLKGCRLYKHKWTDTKFQSKRVAFIHSFSIKSWCKMVKRQLHPSHYHATSDLFFKLYFILFCKTNIMLVCSFRDPVPVLWRVLSETEAVSFHFLSWLRWKDLSKQAKKWRSLESLTWISSSAFKSLLECVWVLWSLKENRKLDTYDSWHSYPTFHQTASPLIKTEFT